MSQTRQDKKKVSNKCDNIYIFLIKVSFLQLRLPGLAWPQSRQCLRPQQESGSGAKEHPPSRSIGHGSRAWPYHEERTSGAGQRIAVHTRYKERSLPFNKSALIDFSRFFHHQLWKCFNLWKFYLFYFVGKYFLYRYYLSINDFFFKCFHSYLLLLRNIF